MNKITCSFFSETLQVPVKVTVLLPKVRMNPVERVVRPVQAAYPTLYLLHGAFDEGESYLTHTDLADLVDQYDMAVVLPSVGNTFYVNEPKGQRYYDYVAQELPDYLGRILPLSRTRETTFIGGLSMGGYGAMRSALLEPEKYGKVFSMSGALDLKRAAGFVRICGAPLPEHLTDAALIAANRFDVFALLDEAEGEKLPAMFLSCGESDYFYPNSTAFTEKAREKGADVQLLSLPGDHEWAVWRKALAEIFRWLAAG